MESDEVKVKKTSRRSSRRVSFAEKEQIKVFEKDWSAEKRMPLQELSKNGLSTLISGGLLQPIASDMIEECSIEELKTEDTEPLVFPFETNQPRRKGRPSDMDISTCAPDPFEQDHESLPQKDRISVMEMCSIGEDTSDSQIDDSHSQQDTNTNHGFLQNLSIKSVASPKSILKQRDRPFAMLSPNDSNENNHICSTPSFLHRKDSDGDLADSMELSDYVDTSIRVNNTVADNDLRMNDTSIVTFPCKPKPDAFTTISKMELQNQDFPLSSTRIDLQSNDHTKLVSNRTFEASFLKNNETLDESKAEVSLFKPCPVPGRNTKLSNNLASTQKKLKSFSDDNPNPKRQCIESDMPVRQVDIEQQHNPAISYIPDTSMSQTNAKEKSYIPPLSYGCDTSIYQDKIETNSLSAKTNVSHINRDDLSMHKNNLYHNEDISKIGNISDIGALELSYGHLAGSLIGKSIVDNSITNGSKNVSVYENKSWIVEENSAQENISDINPPHVSTELLPDSLITKNVDATIDINQVAIQDRANPIKSPNVMNFSSSIVRECEESAVSPKTPVVQCFPATTPVSKFHDILTPCKKKSLKSQINELLSSTPLWCMSKKSDCNQNNDVNDNNQELRDLKIIQDRVISKLERAKKEKAELARRSFSEILNAPSDLSIIVKTSESKEEKDDHVIENCPPSPEQVLEAELKQKTRAQAWSVVSHIGNTINFSFSKGKIRIKCDIKEDAPLPYLIKSCELKTIDFTTYISKRIAHVVDAALKRTISYSLNKIDLTLPMLINSLEDTINSYRPILNDIVAIPLFSFTFEDHSKFSFNFVSTIKLTQFKLCGEIIHDAATQSASTQSSQCRVTLRYQHTRGTDMSSAVNEIISSCMEKDQPITATLETITKLINTRQ